MLIVLFITELAALFFISRRLTQMMFMFFLLVVRSRPVAIALLLAIHFPGTVIHELSHLFTAEILGVRTGRLSFEPESIRGENITTGSVMVAHSDPFRRYAIGLAPVIVGIAILTVTSYFLPGIMNAVGAQPADWLRNPQFWYLLLAGYILFAVSNNMFSSPQDLSGFVPFAIAMAVLAAAIYLIGVRVAFTGIILTTSVRILTTLVKSLGVVLLVNLGLFIITGLAVSFITRVFKVKVVFDR